MLPIPGLWLFDYGQRSFLPDTIWTCVDVYILDTVSALCYQLYFSMTMENVFDHTLSRHEYGGELELMDLKDQPSPAKPSTRLCGGGHSLRTELNLATFVSEIWQPKERVQEGNSGPGSEQALGLPNEPFYLLYIHLQPSLGVCTLRGRCYPQVRGDSGQGGRTELLSVHSTCACVSSSPKSSEYF